MEQKNASEQANTARKQAVRDLDLGAEAYWFQGYSQPFPVHFHPWYVLGLVEVGGRRLRCKGKDQILRSGDILIFNPGDSHSCDHSGGPLTYRSIELPLEAMMAALPDRPLPVFSQTVVQDGETALRLRRLHQRIFDRAGPLEKEEALTLLLDRLLTAESGPEPPKKRERAEVERVCAYIQGHYAQRVRMEQLCREAGLSASALLRAFTRQKGITPYRYLETVRVSEAKSLLERGASLAEAAQACGFADQSHFTNHFRSLMGLPPGAYREMLSEEKEGLL